MQTWMALLCGLLLGLVGADRAAAQTHFVEVGTERGILDYTMAEGFGAGVLAADPDDDGDVDLFVPNGVGVPDQFYRNLGDGTFEEVAADVGLDFTESHRGGIWFDYDADRDLDLVLVAGECELPCTRELLHLYRQEPDGTFVDVSAEAGLLGIVTPYDGMHIGGVSAGDLNGDGHLDLYLAFWGGDIYLFLNDGDGAFLEVAGPAGLQDIRPHWQSVLVDIDGDGLLDVVQAVDFIANLLWINQGDGTFVDVAEEAGFDNAFNEMGVALGDCDHDGDFEIYITNLFINGKHNIFYRNDSSGGDLSFREISRAAGVDGGYCGWGTTFLDHDNNGWLDLAATNGGGAAEWATDPSLFFRSDDTTGLCFTDVSTEVGFDDTEWGSSLVAVDFDRDGDLDLAQSCNRGGPLLLLDNRLETAPDPGRHLVVKPRMRGPNHRALGAVVRARLGAVWQTRLITAGTSFLGQEPAEAFFGLGPATTVDCLVIEWPDGRLTTLTDVATGGEITVWDDAESDLGVLPVTGSSSGDTHVNLTGCGLRDGRPVRVFFGEQEATIQSLERDRIVVRTPPGEGTVDVTVRTSHGVVRRTAAFRYLSPIQAARAGNVNTGRGEREDVLLVNGEAGVGDRVLTVGLASPIRVELRAPSSLPQADWVLWASSARVDDDVVVQSPFDLGLFCVMPPFAGGRPFRTWNRLGYEALLGVSYRVVDPAPTTVEEVPGLSRPLVMALQGLIRDDASRTGTGVSITNGMIVEVR